MAEREVFEPPCRLPGKTLSRRPRYDHFGTSPFLIRSRSPLRGDFPPALAWASLALRLAPAGPLLTDDSRGSSVIDASSRRTLESPCGIPLRECPLRRPAGDSGPDARAHASPTRS